MGVFMWPVMTFFTNSTIHMVALGLRAPRVRLDPGRRRALPARPHLPAALVDARSGLRLDLRRPRIRPVHGARHRSDSRSPLARGRGSAPMRKAAFLAA